MSDSVHPLRRSPPGSFIPGILQARTLERVAISFFNAWKWKLKVKSLSRVWLFVTPWAAAYQAPSPMGFSRQEYWSGLLVPSLGRKWRTTKEPLDESEKGEWKIGLNFNIQKTKIMASGPIISWELDGEMMEMITEFILGGSRITEDGDCSHEIKRCLLLGRKVMTNLYSILKSRDITLPTKVHLVKTMFFPVSCMDVRVGV